ncbi:sulfite exporter TauE/SafE family protein [Nesterenkonia ebinurensis]|uniref:sulfite exporter TauE/SafE family protein n=1 Tax=Nesterenkonia ebinurensis TaxID=2608252 RepID=UPI00168B1C1E|nr:sulfite exporter TauE/SafE family protein [Nesterenkonia ebinurensis]
MAALGWISLSILAVVFATSVVQRVTGSGFGLILSPFVVLLIGAHEGVMLSNFLAIFAPAFVLWRTWRAVEWKRLLWLLIPAIAVMPPAAWVSVRAHEGVLYIAVGSLVIFGILLSLVVHRIRLKLDGPLTRITTGAAVGTGTVLAAVGAPATAIYTALSRWSIPAMVATVQPLWIVVSVVSFGTKWAMDDGQLPALPWWAWPGSVVAIVAGMYAGEWFQRHMNESWLRRTVTLVALLGGVLALGMGIGVFIS